MTRSEPDASRRDSLRKDTRLRRAPDLTLELTAGSGVELILDGRSFHGNHLTLALLDTFSVAKTVEAGLEELRPRIRSARARRDYARHLAALHRWGVLQDPDRQPPRLRSHLDWFDAAPVHIRMLNDRARTASFQRAIRETVTSDDVVVDVGTGTGVLAITAAQAGARHVYAIEGSSMGQLAQRNFVVNRLADRITLIEGRSIHVDLPEKADVLVSEIIGNDPLDESILETTADAVERLLKPGARLIPADLRIYGLPVQVPGEWLEEHLFTEDATDDWQSWYGLDFSVLSATARQQSHALYTSTYRTRDWPRLAEPVLLAEIDLQAIDLRQIESRAEVRATAAGELNGIVVYFETRLSESVDFSIHPSEASPENSWASKVWIAGAPLALKAGEVFGLRYAYGKEGSSFEIESAAALARSTLL